MTPLLGPAVCIGCRRHVYWNGISWRNEGGERHVCPAPVVQPDEREARRVGVREVAA